MTVERDVFVARTEASNLGTSRIVVPGGLYQKEQYGLILADAPESGRIRKDEGQVLVEHEPLRFELAEFVEGRKRSEERTEVEVDAQPTHASNVFNLTFYRGLYFGRGHSVPTGSPVTLIFANQSKVDFTWGVSNRLLEWRLLRMMSAVASNTPKVVAGTKFLQKVEYTARLTTYYADGTMLTRPIRRGVYQVNVSNPNISEGGTSRFFNLQTTFFDHFRPLVGESGRNRGKVGGYKKSSILTTTRPTGPTTFNWNYLARGKKGRSLSPSYRNHMGHKTVEDEPNLLVTKPNAATVINRSSSREIVITFLYIFIYLIKGQQGTLHKFIEL